MKYLLIIFLLFGLQLHCFGQANFNHNVIWGRLVLADTLSNKLKYEIFIQHRRQNLIENDWEVWKAPQFQSYWAWLTYSVNKNLKIAISPFGYFKSWVLISRPSEIERPETRELRWVLRIDQEQKFRKFSYNNRYSLEYRWRDLGNNNVFLPNWRARYQARLDIPIATKHLKKPLSVSFFEEIFIQFGRD